MTGELPLVTAIVPVHNGVQFVGAALDSIKAQSYSPLEVIVVDDGSTDGTRDAVLAHPLAVHCVRQVQKGPAAARNRGLQIARGDLISFLDADDRWPPGRLAHHVELLSRDPKIDLVIGPTRILSFDATLGRAKVVLPVPLVQHSLGSITCRASVFRRIGGLNPRLTIGEDKEWFQRALDQGIVVHVTAEVALDCCLRPGSLTYGAALHKQGLLRALRVHLRDRASGSTASAVYAVHD